MAWLGVDDLIGRSLGRYELRQLLGRGGMGTVYLAHQTSPDRNVAVKALMVSERSTTARFAREAQVLADLEHPHVVPIYDFGLHDGISYIVMRLMPGGSLTEQLIRRRLSHGEIVGLVGELANALDYAHSQGVIHRDLKPSNVLYDRHGAAYLADFGVAKLFTNSNQLTVTGLQLGTPSYMAPELWREQVATPATDIYALGIIVYQLLTGELPFVGQTWLEFAGLHLTRRHPPPQSIDRAVPPAVDAVLAQALAKDPRRRFASARAFSEALMSALPEGAPFHSGLDMFATGTAVVHLLVEPPVDALESTARPTNSSALSSRQSNPFASSDLTHSVPVGPTRSLGSAKLARTTSSGPSPRAKSVSHRRSLGCVGVGVLGFIVLLFLLGPFPPPPPPPTTPTAAGTGRIIDAVTLVAASMTPDFRQPSQISSSPTFPAEPGSLKPDRRRIEGQLSGDAPSDTMRIAWAQGDRVDIQLHSRDFDGHLRLIDPSGAELASSDDCGMSLDPCILEQEISTTGEYVILADSFDHTSTGNYVLLVANYGACGPMPVAVIVVDSAHLRDGPNTYSEVLASLASDECFPIGGRAGDWYQVTAPDGQIGWLYEGVINVVGDEDAVPLPG